MSAEEFREKRNQWMFKFIWWVFAMPVMMVGIYALARKTLPTFRLPFLP
ncbi:MAG: hypothetical protein Q8P56_02575 [Candidatus Uhrbacteria bacterium]|nr:hypothetical protein [Candidatus Uhrbacteria bacterium]